jgi:hypothetical protein
MGRSALIKGLLGLRMLPHMFREGKKSHRRKTIKFRDFVEMGFIPLAEAPPDEMVLGLVGQFWKPNARLVAIAPNRFRSFNAPGYCKAVWNIQVRPMGPQQATLTTTTRIFCPDRRTRRLFAGYWCLIRPFSGLIRKMLLHLIRCEAEEALAGCREYRQG